MLLYSLLTLVFYTNIIMIVCVSTVIIGLALLLAFNADVQTVGCNLIDLAWAFLLSYSGLLTLWKSVTPINSKLQRYRDVKLKQLYQLEELPTSKAQFRIIEEPFAINPSGVNEPTCVRVHREHLSGETLDFYKLPWERDGQDSDYIIIKKWIPDDEQDVLFEHTRKLRERREALIKHHYSATSEPPDPPERFESGERAIPRISRRSKTQRF